MIWARPSKDAEALEAALEGHGPRDSEVQHLVQLAESLCESAIEPSPDFVQNLRAELLADAATVLVASPRPVRTATASHGVTPARRRLAAATAGVLATAGMLGIVASSAQAVPGEMLYPVKRGVESIELLLHRSDASRGSFQLGQATERLAEARSLANDDTARADKLLTESLTAFADQANSGSEDLFADYVSAGNSHSIDEINLFATTSSTTLSDLAGRLPPGTHDVFQMAATTVTSLASRASTLCESCSTAELTSLAKTVASFVEETNKQHSMTNEPSAPAQTPSLPGATDSTSSPPKLPSITPPQVPDPQHLKGTLLGDEDQDGLVPGLLDDTTDLGN